MKLEKHCSLIVVLLFFSFSALSCTSRTSGVLVPNERNVILQNLASEYCSIGESYIELKKFSKAVAAYQRALALDPKDVRIQYSLAGALTLNKQWTDAAELYRLLLSRDPANTTLQLSLAYVYAQQNNFSDALAIYGRLYEENPLNTNVLTNYGLILVHLDQYDQAQILLSELSVLSPEGEGTKQLSESLKAALDPQFNSSAD